MSATLEHRPPIASGSGVADGWGTTRVRYTATCLSSADHHEIARQVVELLHATAPLDAEQPDLAVQPAPPAAMYLKAEQLMARYQVSAKFIRNYAVELGATRLSPARNSKLRYHLPTADAFIASRRKQAPPRRAPGAARRSKPRTRTPGGAPLVDFV